MTKTEIKQHVRLYNELDALADKAARRDDTRNEGRYLDARAEIARVIYEADYATWKSLPDLRKQRLDAAK